MIESWMQADKDGDGKISREEFLAMPRMQQLSEERRDKIFQRFDKNGDGSVSVDELKKLAEGAGPRGLPRLPELDTDHSGGVSFEEFKADKFVQKLPAERQETLFKSLDRDGDGQITPKDRPEPREGRDGRDGREGRDGRPDGKMRDGVFNRQLLKRLDTNGDGAVDFAEFQKAPFVANLSEDAQEARFQKMDRNGDHKLTAEDFPPPSEDGDRPRPDGDRPDRPHADGDKPEPRGDRPDRPHGPKPPEAPAAPKKESPAKDEAPMMEE